MMFVIVRVIISLMREKFCMMVVCKFGLKVFRSVVVGEYVLL